MRHGMVRGKIFLAACALVGLMGVSGAASATLDLNDCGNGQPCPYVTYGDGNSYSLPSAAILWDYYNGGGTGPGNPFYVNSSAGQIQDLVVIATGASGTGVNTNFPGMDNAYPTPNKTGTAFFSTGTTADPSPAFSGDQANTWDTTLSALSGFLGSGNAPIFFFNNNQVNSGASTNQELAVWLQISLTGTGLPTQYFDLTNQDQPFATFDNGGGGVLNGDPTNYASTGAGPIAGTNAATDYVLSGGQLCADANFNPVPCDGNQTYTINHNLGANQAAYAVIFPELNHLFFLQNFGGYDTLHIDLRMGCDPNTIDPSTNCVGRSLNDGYEQLFMGAITPGGTVVPEPGSLALFGAGLIGLAAWRRKA